MGRVRIFTYINLPWTSTIHGPVNIRTRPMRMGHVYGILKRSMDSFVTWIFLPSCLRLMHLAIAHSMWQLNLKSFGLLVSRSGKPTAFWRLKQRSEHVAPVGDNWKLISYIKAGGNWGFGERWISVPCFFLQRAETPLVDTKMVTYLPWQVWCCGQSVWFHRARSSQKFWKTVKVFTSDGDWLSRFGPRPHLFKQTQKHQQKINPKEEHLKHPKAEIFRWLSY